MPNRYATLLRRYGPLSSFAIVLVVAAFVLLGMSRPSVDTPVPPTPAPLYTATPERTSTPLLIATSRPPDTPTAVPTEVPTAEPTAAPDVLPDPAPPADTPAPPPPAPATATSAPPAARAPRTTPAPDPNILPNGVRYGERRPNLPSRIVRIASPDVKLDAKVYEVYAVNGAWEVAEYAAGHHFNTNNPGEGGNIVLSGHNNWKGEVFRYLEFLKVGDLIQVWTLDGKEHRYRVAEVKKLKEAGVPMAQRIENGKVMLPTDHEQLTLITCWPYTTYTHRLVVIALPED